MLILRGGGSASGDAYRGDVRGGEEVVIQFRPLAITVALWGLGVGGVILAIFIALTMLVFDPWRGVIHSAGDSRFMLALCGMIVIAAPIGAFVGLRLNTFTVRIDRDFVVARRGWKECFHQHRQEIAQLACLWQMVVRTDRSEPGIRMRYDLAAFDARGKVTPVFEGLPREHAMFVEVWAESVLGLADAAVAREVT